MLQICQNIKQARLSLGKSQQEIADLIGVKRTTYANWENNTEPDMTTIKSLSKILGVSVSDILQEK